MVSSEEVHLLLPHTLVQWHDKRRTLRTEKQRTQLNLTNVEVNQRYERRYWRWTCQGQQISQRRCSLCWGQRQILVLRQKRKSTSHQYSTEINKWSSIKSQIESYGGYHSRLSWTCWVRKTTQWCHRTCWKRYSLWPVCWLICYYPCQTPEKIALKDDKSWIRNEVRPREKALIQPSWEQSNLFSM